MEKPTALFYLLKSVDKNGNPVYVHKILPNMVGDNQLIVTYHPEFSERSMPKKPIEDLLERVNKTTTFISRDFKWEIVRYRMEVEQMSWAHKPAIVEWTNHMEG